MRFLFIMLTLLLMGCQPKPPQKIVGIIEPISHKAITEIVTGFTQELKRLYPGPLKIEIANAQGDINIQRAIIQKMRDSHYDVIAPIGLDATQMSLAMAKSQAVVGLAANTNIAEKHLKNCQVAIVNDEIPVQKTLTLIHAIYPHLTYLTLIHSSSNKILPQVNEAIAAAREFGIHIQPKMVSSLAELYQVSSALDSHTEALLVLKDNLIVSGIANLVRAAATKSIPLITSDQGSVVAGATFALGVREQNIGYEGARLTAQILNKNFPCGTQMVNVKDLEFFINPKSLSPELINHIKQTIKPMHYGIVPI